MSSSSRPAPSGANSKILTIDWLLLWRRLRTRTGQVFTAARFRAGQTEYIPPAWLRGVRISWFRLGLAGLLLFVLTRKQVDFTVSMGKAGIAAGMTEKPGSATTVPEAQQTSLLSILPDFGEEAPAVPAWSIDSYDAATVRAYINRFERVAQTEEEKYSIPAPAKMAMAILDSQAGKSGLAKADNNHFSTATKGAYYDNAWANWRAHSEHLQLNYPQLAHESVNYQQWLAALAKTGYSRDPQYANKLVTIIERFGLERL